MAGSNAGTSAASDATNEFVITRSFDAPRVLVFKAFTEAERLARWWGPKGFTWVTGKLDLQPGGLFHYCMRAPNGPNMWGKFVYREIVAPERIVFVNSFSNENGDTVRAPFHANWPLEVMNTLTLNEHEGKTTLTLRGYPVKASEAELKAFKDGYKSMQQGFGATFDQLADYLAKEKRDSGVESAGHAGGARWSKKRELTIERVFNAPRELVFQAWSKPEHVAQWWGPRGFMLPTCEMEFRAGGRFRLVMRGPDGKDYAFQGAYLEIVEPQRIVFQGTIHDEPGHQVWTTVTFAEEAGKTKLTVQQTYSFESDATRGAPEGWRQTLDRLGEYLARA